MPRFCAIAAACFITAIALGQDVVVLTSGETLHGSITELTAETLTLDHPVLGTLAINRESVESFQIQDAPDTPDSPDTPPSPPAEPEPPALPEPEPAPQFPWKLQLELGINGSVGTNDTINFRVGFRGNRARPEDRIRFDTSYLYATDGSNTTQNRFTAGVIHDWLLPDSKWIFFAQGRYDYDEFRDWEHRVSGNAGLGYDLVRTDKLDVTLRAGAGAVHSWGIVNETDPEALLAAEVSWRINDSQTLTASNFLHPELDDLGEFRNLTKIDWTAKIDRASGMSLRFGIENEYRSRTSGRTRHNDLKFYGALVIDF